ncbi:MAG: ATP-binding protein [candidate division WOR-3 bacterium]
MSRIGVLVGETKPLSATMVSKQPTRVGQYVFVSYEEHGKTQRFLALVQRVWRANPFLEEGLTDPEHAIRIMELEKWDSFYRTELSIVGQVEEGRLSFPKSPPLPGAEVSEADEEGLREVLGAEDEADWARIGTLLGSDAPVYMNIDQIVLRHLAVLAVTGGGKSNAVGVILQEMVRRGGTAIVFDPHGEYGTMGEDIRPFINPFRLTVDELAGLLGIDMERSSIQYYLLQTAKKEMDEEMKKSNITGEDDFDWRVIGGTDFFQALSEKIESFAIQEQDGLLRGISRKQDSVAGLLIRIENLKNNLGDLFSPKAPPLIERIREGKINAVNLSGIGEDAGEIVAAHLLRHILYERKKAAAGQPSHLPRPAFVVLEEAHLFCPDKESTRTKTIASRIAREGRKFGLGLCLVSQRPKRLDPDVLSQMNNMIVLRIVEPSDQRHIAEASENLSADLVQYLPSLNPGEAVCTGPAFRVPLLVKIAEAKNKPTGRDIPVTASWKEPEKRMSPEEAQDLYG